MRYRELVRKLERLGVRFLRQARGSHELWLNTANGRRTTIPNHAGKEIGPQLLGDILSDLGLTLEDLNQQ